MKKLILFFTIRSLDLLTTYLVINKYGGGWKVEGNPVYQYLVRNNSYLAVIITNLLISLLIYLVFTKFNFLRKWFKVVIGGMGMIVVWNFMTYILI